MVSFKPALKRDKHLLWVCFLSVFMVVFYAPMAQADCPNKGAPSIAIKMSSTSIEYDFSKSQDQLQNFKIDTKSPYDNTAHTKVGGLMNGEISVNSQVSFGWAQNKRDGSSCYWYNDIEVKMHIRPIIFIASEHEKGTCSHNAIMEHEMKHVKVDRAMLKKYSDLIESDLRKVVRKVGTVGPVSRRSTERARSKMMRIVEKTVNNRTEAMYAERRKLQQAVDSLEEYERVQAQCN
tara:strand:+ start:29 stop:733 length:705 start_codon:yes stop_codon:yes gene_type:complete